MIDKQDIKELFQSLVIAGILAFFIINFVAQSFVVEGRSMQPTLEDRERLFVNKFIYRFRPPERYDVIVFTPRTAPGSKYIKRVIGLPGESVYINNGTTYINGEPLDEDYINEAMRHDFGPVEIPENSVFVMGDNRNHSADSRIIGNVDYDSISGKAFWVYWPLNRIRVLNHGEGDETDDL